MSDPWSSPARARLPSQRTFMYASSLRISRALHLDVFEQPEENYFFNNLLNEQAGIMCSA
jgi:hypothetical protein